MFCSSLGWYEASPRPTLRDGLSVGSVDLEVLAERICQAQKTDDLATAESLQSTQFHKQLCGHHQLGSGDALERHSRGYQAQRTLRESISGSQLPYEFFPRTDLPVLEASRQVCIPIFPSIISLVLYYTNRLGCLFTLNLSMVHCPVESNVWGIK